jgi:hypothetical protein
MRRAFTWLIVFVAVLGLGIGASYAAGVVYGRRTAPAPTATPSAAAQAGATGGQQGQGAAGTGSGGGQGGRQGAGAGTGAGAGAAGGPLVATVSSVEGNTLKVMANGGTETTVTLGDSTKIGMVGSSDSGALSPGASVLLMGQRGQDGSFTPTSVIVLPAGFTVR